MTERSAEHRRPRLMRADDESRSEVAPIELFFDLVYVSRSSRSRTPCSRI
ncbi:hypothetical protein [Pseudonocardia zijingensis]